MSMSPNLSVTFLGRELSTPLVLASGIWGTTVSLLERAAADGCGAVTAKSCGPAPRSGHVNPSCIDWGGGLLNAIGLANPGVEEEVGLLREARARLQPRGVPVLASIFAGTAAEFGEVARRVARARPDGIEVNISCPNVEDSFGEPFAANADSAAAVTQYVKEAVAETKIPVIVKLAPNVPSVGRIAAAVVHAGADALCAINTMPGLIIDPTAASRSSPTAAAASAVPPSNRSRSKPSTTPAGPVQAHPSSAPAASAQGRTRSRC